MNQAVPSLSQFSQSSKPFWPPALALPAFDDPDLTHPCKQCSFFRVPPLHTSAIHPALAPHSLARTLPPRFMAASAALVFAGKSVATPAISFLVNKAFTYLNKYLNAEGMPEMKDRIQGRLDQIQAVFDVVSPERIKGESRALDAWLWKLRNAVEKAEDALDVIEYYELEKKAKDRKVSNWGSSLDKIKHNAMKSVKQTTIVGKAFKGLTHHVSLKRLCKALEGLDKAAAGVADFITLAERLKGCTSQQEDDFLKDRETSSKLTAPEVFGRDTEKELLIGWLTKTSCEDGEIKANTDHVSIVSIVGHGGMGKTTLAQLICQDDSVREHFEIVIWACVSTSFDATTVTIKILESATWETPNAVTLEGLHKILEEKVKSVKFLLVLDDVWDDKKNDQWEKLFAPLRAGKSGSKILLTTRMQSVADFAAHALGGQNNFLALQGLKKDENIKLFNCHAFPKDSFQHYAAFQPIGEQIVKNLRGCPLVTKVVASHLRDNLSFQYWTNFLHQRLQHFGGTADDIMSALKLSYYHLPTEMQSCFRYCSIFPQDFVFDKEQLVKMWVSSGLISQVAVGSESLMNIGEQYLDQLTRKSFLDASFANEKYVMHDLMHDLARYVSLGECARIVDVGSLDNLASTVRHVCIELEHITNLPVEKIMEITPLENLRTIIIKGKHRRKQKINNVTLNIAEQLVKSSKSLRLFQTELGHTSDFVGKLAVLKHLRFVELPQWIPPECLCGFVKLYHLTTIKCRRLHIKQNQLRDVANIEAHLNLMELCVSDFSGTIIPIWAEKLSVQNLVKLELKSFGRCGQLSSLEKLLRLKELKLENLPKLKRIGRELDVSGNECAELFWPPNLLKLEVRDCPRLKELPLLPPSLGSLWIDEVGLTKFARMGWLELDIRVESCQSLTSLELEQAGSWVIINCVQLESATLLRSGTIKSLEIIGCPKLAEAAGLSPNMDVSGGGEEQHQVVPRSSLQVERLEIDLPSLLLVEPLNSLSQSECLTIEDGSEMESIPEGWLLQNRSSLRSLEVWEAKSLESLPSSIRDLSSLEKLRLTSAGKLRSLPDLPSSLKELYIWGCHSELEDKVREFGSPERNKICHVQLAIIGDSYFNMGNQCDKGTLPEIC